MPFRSTTTSNSSSSTSESENGESQTIQENVLSSLLGEETSIDVSNFNERELASSSEDISQGRKGTLNEDKHEYKDSSNNEDTNYSRKIETYQSNIESITDDQKENSLNPVEIKTEDKSTSHEENTALAPDLKSDNNCIEKVLEREELPVKRTESDVDNDNEKKDTDNDAASDSDDDNDYETFVESDDDPEPNIEDDIDVLETEMSSVDVVFSDLAAPIQLDSILVANTHSPVKRVKKKMVSFQNLNQSFDEEETITEVLEHSTCADKEKGRAYIIIETKNVYLRL